MGSLVVKLLLVGVLLVWASASVFLFKEYRQESLRTREPMFMTVLGAATGGLMITLGVGVCLGVLCLVVTIFISLE